jgi:hypothetical protein
MPSRTPEISSYDFTGKRVYKNPLFSPIQPPFQYLHEVEAVSELDRFNGLVDMRKYN